MPLNCASSPCLTFAVIQRNLKLRASVFVAARSIGSKRLLYYSSSSEKLSELMDTKPRIRTPVVKECVAKARKVETEVTEDDPDTIERMTVQELRSKLRSVGVPSKGSKRDLVSALKGFLNNKVDGEDSLVVEDWQSSETKPICTEKNSSKRKAKSLSGEEHVVEVNSVLEVSELQCTKRRVKQVQVDDSIEEVKTTVVTTKQKLSIKTDEVSGKKPTQLKRKAPAEIASRLVEASGEANLSVNQNEPWTILAHKKPQKGWVAYNPKTMRTPPLTGDTKFMKLLSWNVNGLRALLKLKDFSALQLAQREDFDVLCLQETKLQARRNLLALSLFNLP
ncbi:DNA-(apurinic or apyrimidinic site) lyase, chloroplastic-like isoform X1 [Camellia sinensis]|uniref:DNA-(apurinic or apyrimidinic site) lyase, chloroplastic-like isoform X1 n=2 Tax=Camellia sinensis TaxID=4442 RepID=UPI0010368C69|nr:DNA-(apurinic or apyrimidinic site) lyase, chloroplastic-like isoform X1 [Camellia sinensis]